MNKKIGKVIDKFIPTEFDKNNNLVESDRVGFRILINNELITLIEKQNKRQYKN